MRTDLVTQLSRYEAGDLTPDATVALFQHLVDTGLVWQLQESYGRTALGMIQNGVVIVDNQTPRFGMILDWCESRRNHPPTAPNAWIPDGKDWEHEGAGFWPSAVPQSGIVDGDS